MTGIDYFAWFVFIVIILSAVYIFVALAELPGKTARARNHPQADAINIASWLGLLLTMGVVWVIAMIWSRMVPVVSSGGAEIAALRARVAELESEVNAKQREKS